MKTYRIEIVMAAKAAHEANRILYTALGDDSQTCWEDAPKQQQTAAKETVRGLCCYPNTTAKGLHRDWMGHAIKNGWAWGPVLDVDNKKHPHMMPYEELPIIERATNEMFLTVAGSMLRAMGVIE